MVVVNPFSGSQPLSPPAERGSDRREGLPRPPRGGRAPAGAGPPGVPGVEVLAVQLPVRNKNYWFKVYFIFYHY